MRTAPFLASCLVLVLASPADAALKDKKTLVIEGRTIDAEGFPIPKVRVALEGPRRRSVMSNVDGQYSLRIPIGTPSDLKRAPLRLALVAERRGERFTIPGGDRRLGLEIGLEAVGSEPGRCVARSNDERVAASAARIVALEGDVVGLVVVNFIGAPGAEPAGNAWPALTQVAQAALSFPLSGPVASLPAAERAPAVTRAAPEKPARSSWSILGDRSPRKSRTDEHRRGGSRDSGAEGERRARLSAGGESGGRAPHDHEITTAKGQDADRAALDRSLPPAPPPSPSPTPPPPPSIIPEPPPASSRARALPLVIRNPSPTRSRPDSCECRVEGTVEVQTGAPIKNPERIEVSLQWYPQLRDTVDLFMGSPRPFRLPVAPCGPQRLRLRVLTSGRFDVSSRQAMAGFRCDGSRVFQPRIVLVPR